MIYDKSKYIKCEWCGVSVAPQLTYPIQYRGIYLVMNGCLGCMLEHNDWMNKQEDKNKNK